MLACNHKCTGKCENCRTKRLHVACEKECGRELICSHVSLLNKERLVVFFRIIFRYVKNLVQLVVHHAYVNVKHVVYILNVKRDAETYVHHAKRFR
jgi:hypothetical protein